MNELYVNGILLDLEENENPIAINMAVNMLGSPMNRKSTISRFFKVPMTERNRKALGFPDLDLLNSDPYRQHPAKLVQNGVEVFPNAIARVESCSTDGIEIYLISAMIDLFQILSDSNLSDLNLSHMDHTFDRQTFRTTQRSSNGFKYPLIAYGQLPNASDEGLKVIPYQSLRPAIFAKTLLHEVLTQAGFTYSGSLLTDPKFALELLPFSRDKFRMPASYDYSRYSVETKSNAGFSYLYNDNRSNNSVTLQPPLPDVVSDPAGSWENNEYTAKANVELKVLLNYVITYESYYDHGPGRPERPYLRVVWEKFNPSTGQWGNFGDQIGYYRNAQYNDAVSETAMTESIMLLDEGDRIRLSFKFFTDKSEDRMLVTLGEGYNIRFDSVDREVRYGEPVSMSANLPELNQRDFIMDIMQRYCLTPVIDNDRRHVSFRSYLELYANMRVMNDWTKKIHSASTEVKFDLDPNFAGRNYLKYKSDEGVPMDLGTGIIHQEFKRNSEYIMITSSFAATPIEIIYGRPMSSIPKYTVTDGVYEWKEKSEPRILLDSIVPDDTYRFTGPDDPESNSGDGFISIPLFEIPGGYSLSYESFIKEYWGYYKRFLRQPRREEYKVHLTEKDIAELDFFVPVFNRERSQAYYINKIEEYVSQEYLCKVELVRM